MKRGQSLFHSLSTILLTVSLIACTPSAQAVEPTVAATAMPLDTATAKATASITTSKPATR
jgi:hypothetical protein